MEPAPPSRRYTGGSGLSGERLDRWGEVYWPLWRSHGHLDEFTETSALRFGSETQGRFTLGVMSSTIDEARPWNVFEGYADGTYYADGYLG